MPITQCFSDAVVLSPGVWGYIMAFTAGNDGHFRSALHLNDLLNAALISSLGSPEWPIDLPLDHSHLNVTSDVESPHLMKLDRIAPCDGPAVLLIHLPSEAAADIAAL
ncbi:MULTISPECIES: hypothetical protein [unclassified Pseudomonas]|uniref:hypothetical protein n=1 Tax=unclassified Pseudomonas TaxID=196821 RepID=UPI0025D71155|nr:MULTISPECIES: hypothetical protein [unclassified Pseudomonas]